MAQPDLARTVEADLTVVGAGPAGLYAAYYSGFRGLSCAVIDALPEPGGQVAAMYPEKQIYDIAGLPAVRGRDLVNGLLEQANKYSPTYLLGSPAHALSHEPDGSLVVSTEAGTTVRTRAVVITGGIGSFSPRPLPAGRAHEGKGLVYFVPSLQEMADRDVVIVGGGDSACDWALSLEGIARSVTLVHRRAAFRAHAASVDALLASSVEVITDAQVTEISGDDWVESVTITNKARELQERKCQAVVAALGFTADLGPIEQWGLNIVDRQISVGTTMETGVPRVYAAGDITEYAGKVRLIAVGFGEAATAVNNATVAIDPSAKVFPGHSSEGP